MPQMTIVAATDFSDPARAAVQRAALVARAHSAQLMLVYAHDQTKWSNLRSLATPKTKLLADQPVHRAWEQVQLDAGELARKHGIRASGVVATGRAAKAIAATAKAARASLVVLGPHSRRLGDRLYLGSTALGAARSVTVPVLVVCSRPKASSSYARCLVGVDFSPPSLHAATTAARLFPTTAITLLHAVQSIDGPMLFTGALRHAIDQAKARMRLEAQKRLARWLPAGQPGRLDSAARRAVIAPTHLALQETLKAGRFDLVALGRDSKAALAERVLGSVPANLLMHSTADILIVP